MWLHTRRLAAPPLHTVLTWVEWYLFHLKVIRSFSADISLSCPDLLSLSNDMQFSIFTLIWRSRASQPDNVSQNFFTFLTKWSIDVHLSISGNIWQLYNSIRKKSEMFFGFLKPKSIVLTNAHWLLVLHEKGLASTRFWKFRSPSEPANKFRVGCRVARDVFDLQSACDMRGRSAKLVRRAKVRMGISATQKMISNHHFAIIRPIFSV